jgi:hypothetical protein
MSDEHFDVGAHIVAVEADDEVLGRGLQREREAWAR